MVFSKSFLTATLLLILAGCATVPSGPDATLSVASTRHEEVSTVLRCVAFNSARDISAIYASADEQQLPGVKALGRQLQAVLTDETIRIDFVALVHRNPEFWRAAIELHVADESLPLLFAALGVLGGDAWNANRVLILAQATLPLPTGIRATYLAHSTPLVGTLLAPAAGLPPAATLNSVEDCNRYEALVEARLRIWPDNALLLSELIDVRVRRAFYDQRKQSREVVTEQIDAALTSSAGEVERLQAIDALSAARFVADGERRRVGRELTAAWVQIASRNAPAETPVLEQSVAFFAEAGRPDIAFMVQRFLRVQRGVPTAADLARERELIGQLVPADDARGLVGLMESERAGGGRLSIDDPVPSAAWTGDPTIHPVLAQTIERALAQIDFNLGGVSGNPRAEGGLRHDRGVQLSRAGAYDAALTELDRSLGLLGRAPRVLVDKAIVLSSMGRDAEADAIFQELAGKRGERLMSAGPRGQHLFGRGEFAAALTCFQEAAKGDEENPYLAIMAELAARRAGVADEKKLVRAVQGEVPGGSWPGICLRFLDGELTERELLDAAGKGSDYDTLQKRCEAYFILAQIALAEGRRDDGVRRLRECVDTGFTAFVEHRLAKRELSRLAPEPAQKRPGERAPSSFGDEVLGFREAKTLSGLSFAAW